MRRSPLLAFFFLALAAIAVVGYLFLLSVLSGKVGPFSAAIPAIFLALAALAINWRFLKAEGRSLAELGFDRPLLRFRQVTVAFVAGAITVAAWVIAMRWILPVAWRVAPSFRAPAAAGSFVFVVFNNLGEELVYRSYLFLLLTRSYGTVIAIVSTSLLFALLHKPNSSRGRDRSRSVLLNLLELNQRFQYYSLRPKYTRSDVYGRCA